ncbi:class E sortase [Actinomadura sp. KC06]|uniref:class E sortase n=1 Tax=Actinomadura sp. KC06 TaxID=2530369 RepID=UPI00104EB537|nr:class E sortase [Actinomadura sp. KC06]TDD27453.1 class E sortase [Actinomadura sp. KC06]
MLDRKSVSAAAIAVCCGLPVAGVPQAQAMEHGRTQARAQAHAGAAAVSAVARPRKGAVIAHLRIRRMGLKAEVREGVSEPVLRRGVGHYPGTGLPGRDGNTVLLGHRTTWLRPFNELDRMRRGDRIVLRVGRTSYTYRMRSMHVIKPRDRRVLEPVPFKPLSAPDGEYVTLITCTPKGSDRRRLVVIGKLVRTSKRGA